MPNPFSLSFPLFALTPFPSFFSHCHWRRAKLDLHQLWVSSPRGWMNNWLRTYTSHLLPRYQSIMLGLPGVSITANPISLQMVQGVIIIVEAFSLALVNFPPYLKEALFLASTWVCLYISIGNWFFIFFLRFSPFHLSGKPYSKSSGSTFSLLILSYFETW